MVAIPFLGDIDLQSAGKVTGSTDPSAATDLVTLQYLQAFVRGLDWKESVRVRASGNVTLSAPGASIDGVAMTAGDRFLATAQTAGAENGIYLWNGAAVAATRALDADTATKLTDGATTAIEQGTGAGQWWMLTTNPPITLGTTVLTFVQVGAGGTAYVAGSGLAESPAGTFNVGTGTGISVTADNIAIDTAVVARKFSANVGNGTLTTIDVVHNLGTRDVIVQLRRATTPWERSEVRDEALDANTVRLLFNTAPAANAYRVTVLA